MIGEVFEVDEIDEFGHPWVQKSWPNQEEGKWHSHSIALEPHELEVVDDMREGDASFTEGDENTNGGKP